MNIGALIFGAHVHHFHNSFRPNDLPAIWSRSGHFLKTSGSNGSSLGNRSADHSSWMHWMRLGFRDVWIRNQLSCQEPFSKPSSPSKGWRCSPSWGWYEANSIQQWNEFCQSLCWVSKRTNTRKSITSHHSARVVRKFLLKRLVWRNQQLYALLQTQHSWSCLCSYSDWKSGIMDAAPDIFTWGIAC